MTPEEETALRSQVVSARHDAEAWEMRYGNEVSAWAEKAKRSAEAASVQRDRADKLEVDIRNGFHGMRKERDEAQAERDAFRLQVAQLREALAFAVDLLVVSNKANELAGAREDVIDGARAALAVTDSGKWAAKTPVKT